jgi:hypothetical protein
VTFITPRTTQCGDTIKSKKETKTMKTYTKDNPMNHVITIHKNDTNLTDIEFDALQLALAVFIESESAAACLATNNAGM